MKELYLVIEQVSIAENNFIVCKNFEDAVKEWLKIEDNDKHDNLKAIINVYDCGMNHGTEDCLHHKRIYSPEIYKKAFKMAEKGEIKIKQK